MFERANIEDHWDDIISEVYALSARQNYRPEDVYAACKYGQAHLFLCVDGWVILKEQISNDDKKKELFIWLGASNYTGVSAIIKYENALVELARSIEAERLVFGTLRKGFEKVLSKDWKMREIIWERRV